MPKLLIVDDETDVREFVANFFRKRKLEVITAKNGQEALDLFNKHIPDLTLLDIKMEGLDGVEILKQIRQTDNKAKVIMLTGQRPEEQEAFSRCEELGAVDYIHKPVELDNLEQAVMKTLKIII
jgi:two-component system response regulator (stage 0 sporulation protein F)